ncbi:hypothetical protein EK21DRAFT_87446 [Setomelanomma holmii]|uniref:Clr5 domain-containing protein n=1 Tax=Setomelanomma holmii TaxID=210430 RepID=A0A9P4HCF2_9PLEO|nr:hypothetical protein EK21DRAFT_87446 [Setomelanomma holmii]
MVQSRLLRLARPAWPEANQKLPSTPLTSTLFLAPSILAFLLSLVAIIYASVHNTQISHSTCDFWDGYIDGHVFTCTREVAACNIITSITDTNWANNARICREFKAGRLMLSGTVAINALIVGAGLGRWWVRRNLKESAEERVDRLHQTLAAVMRDELKDIADEQPCQREGDAALGKVQCRALSRAPIVQQGCMHSTFAPTNQMNLDRSHISIALDSEKVFSSRKSITQTPDNNTRSPDSVAQTSNAEATSSKSEYVSEHGQWDELHEIFVILWPGMALAELMVVMDEDYGFRATVDQYKKKFKYWYKRGLLPQKKRRKAQILHDPAPKELEDDEKQYAIVDTDHKLPTPAPTPGHGEGSTHAGHVIELGTYPAEDAQGFTPEWYVPPRNAAKMPVLESQALRTPRQAEFHHLLSDLWDTVFDAEFGHADKITVGEALSNMIEFIIAVSAPVETASTVATRQGDLKLLWRVLSTIRNRWPDDESLLATLEAAVFPAGQQRTHEEAHPQMSQAQSRTPFLSQDEFLRWACEIPDHTAEPYFPVVYKSSFVIFCCHCGDGPYSPDISKGCASVFDFSLSDSGSRRSQSN